MLPGKTPPMKWIPLPQMSRNFLPRKARQGFERTFGRLDSLLVQVGKKTVSGFL